MVAFCDHFFIILRQKVSKIKMKKPVLLFLIIVLFNLSLYAQEDIFGIERKLTSRKSESNLGNITRNFLSFLNLEISSGASYHLDQFLYNGESQLANADELNKFINKFAFKGDSLIYDGYQYSIPINIGVKFEMLSFLTLGGGVSRESGFKNFFAREDETLVFTKSPYQIISFYGSVGLIIFDANRRKQFLNWRYKKYSGDNYYMQSIKKQRMNQRYPWRFILEGEVGKNQFVEPLKTNSLFTEDILEFTSEPNPFFYSLYFRTEFIFSEYSKFFVRVGTSYRSTVFSQNNIPHEYTLNQQLISLNLGLSIALPGTKRCKKPGCGVVMKHYHDGIEYRGSSIFSQQNRKIGQWY